VPAQYQSQKQQQRIDVPQRRETTKRYLQQAIRSCADRVTARMPRSRHREQNAKRAGSRPAPGYHICSFAVARVCAAARWHNSVHHFLNIRAMTAPRVPQYKTPAEGR